MNALLEYLAASSFAGEQQQHSQNQTLENEITCFWLNTVAICGYIM